MDKATKIDDMEKGVRSTQPEKVKPVNNVGSGRSTQPGNVKLENLNMRSCDRATTKSAPWGTKPFGLTQPLSALSVSFYDRVFNRNFWRQNVQNHRTTLKELKEVA